MFRVLLNWFREDKVYKMSCDDCYILEHIAREKLKNKSIKIVRPTFIDWKGDCAILYKEVKKGN